MHLSQAASATQSIPHLQATLDTSSTTTKGLTVPPSLTHVKLHLQATFDISLTTTTGLTALSNMPVIASEDLPTGLTATHFATSPPMSTYLVALIMGNLTSVSTTVPHPDPTKPDRKVSIYGTPDRCAS